MTHKVLFGLCAGLLLNHCNVCFKCVLLYCAAVPLQCVLMTIVLLFRNSKTSTAFYGKAPLHGVQH